MTINHYPKQCIKLAIVFFSAFFCNKLVAQASKNPLINSGELFKIGAKLFEEKKYKDAIASYIKIPENDTNYADAIYEIAYSHYSDSNYTDALKYIELGKTFLGKESIRYLNLEANTLDNMGKYAEAINVYSEGIKQNPNSHFYFYNRALSYLSLKETQKAKVDMQQSILINPYFTSGHYSLGTLLFEEGNLVGAIMAYITYLSIEPEGRYVTNIINNLSAIANATDMATKYASKGTSANLGSFKQIQDIIISKIALDKQYKLKANLEDEIVRQLQVTLEQVKYKANDKSFAMQYYLPLMEKIWAEDYFDKMIFSIFSGLKIEKVQSWVKKNKKEVEKYYALVVPYLNSIRNSRILDKNLRASNTNCYEFDEGVFSGNGSCKNNDGSEFLGAWELYHENGKTKSKGNFNDKKEKDGEWIFYYDNGQIKEKSVYLNGKANGKSDGWHLNGNVWYNYNYKDGKLNGNQKVYFFNGKLKTESNYTDDEINGEEKAYNYKGFLTSTNSYVNGKLEGNSKWYHNNNQLSEEVAYKNDNEDGLYKAFSDNGVLTTEGNFVNGKKEGLWTYYFESGKVKEKTTFVAGEITGEFIEYFENGAISRKGVYTKKKIDGKLEDFDDDGKLFSVFEYDKGKLKEVNHYDKTGNIISTSSTKKGAGNITFFSPSGNRILEGFYNKSGDREGEFREYSPSGKLITESNYKEGLLTGKYKLKYSNGKVKYDSDYEDGEEHGYGTSYAINGQKNAEGWVQFGQRQQTHLTYNVLGDLTDKDYYLDGELTGYSYTYYPGNKINLRHKHKNGWLEEIIQYDTTGKELSVNIFPKGNGPLIYKYFNGKTSATGTYENYILTGPFKYLFFDGSISATKNFKNDLLDGQYQSFYFGGKVEEEGSYKFGEKIGTWKNYYENGKLKTEESFLNGALNGVDKIYRNNGMLDREITYKDGNANGPLKLYGDKNQLIGVINFKNENIISYTYEGKDGNLMPAIPVKKGTAKMIMYYKNGTKSAEMDYIDNDNSGLKNLFYSNGKPLEAATRNGGLYDGVRTIFYEDGKKWQEETLVAGYLHGIQKKWHSNGNLESEIYFYNDNEHGECKYYDVNGKLKQTRTYYHGILLSIK